MTDDEHEEHDDRADDEEDEVATWPIRGPATPQQAMFAIGFVFFLGIVIGFLLCRTF